MDAVDLEKQVRGYLSSVIHMSLSTAKDNKPWTTELHFAYDEALNLYFLSLPSRRHSEEIAHNPWVSGAITKQHLLGEAPVGLYFEGEATLLDDIMPNSSAYQTYRQRFNTDEIWLAKELETSEGHKFFKVIVHDFYVFDAVASNPSQKYRLGWK